MSSLAHGLCSNGGWCHIVFQKQLNPLNRCGKSISGLAEGAVQSVILYVATLPEGLKSFKPVVVYAAAAVHYLVCQRLQDLTRKPVNMPQGLLWSASGLVKL